VDEERKVSRIELTGGRDFSLSFHSFPRPRLNLAFSAFAYSRRNCDSRGPW